MKKILASLLGIAIIIAGVAALLLPHMAFAQATGVPFIGNFLTSVVGSLMDISIITFNKVLMWLGGYALTLSSMVLLISGTLLNAVLNTTMHMSTFVEQVNAIGVTWRTIRDFSSMFFIFILLYSSFQIIFGVSSASTRRLIVMIVVAGLLVNFSLFFTKLIIDASNVVTLGFYSAIMPQNATLADGGISNIFAQQLRIVTQWDPRGLQGAAKANFEAKVGPALWLGSAVMIIAAGSFFVVSLMLIIRIAILILLMAFSPIYFISLVLPNTKKFGDKWLELLVGQAFFAPIYLAIIYVVMLIVSSPEFGNIIMGNEKRSFAQAFIDGGEVGVVMNYIIVIVLLNIALATAMKMGGLSGEYANKGIDLLKKWGPTVTGTSFAARNTLGWVASKADSALADTHLGNSARGRFVRSITTGAAASYKWGGSKSFKDQEKEQKEIKEKRDEINTKKELQTAAALSNYKGVRDTLKKFSNKTVSDLGKDNLTNPIIAAHLTQSQFDDIMKGDKTQDEKNKIAKAREDGLQTMLTDSRFGATEEDRIKAIFEGRKPEEIAKLPSSILTTQNVSIQLEGNILAKISRDGILDRKARETIRQNFDNHIQQNGTQITPQFQKAYDWLNGPGNSLF